MRLRRIGVDAGSELVFFLRSDSHIIKSEGFEARSRLEVRHGANRVFGAMNVVQPNLLAIDEIGLSEAAWRELGGADGDELHIALAGPPASLAFVREKIDGRALIARSAHAIVRDIVAGCFTEVELAAWVTACSGTRMDLAETIAWTRAMADSGARLSWESDIVVDKHCLGGLPGNRTTLIVVPIVAACGLTIPKTSSRAITSAAGTADTMETLAPVSLDLAAVRRVVGREGGCIVWGGAFSLSPADHLLIRIERALGLASDGLMVASVLSKKLAAGASHVLIDIPVGPSAKVRSARAAQAIVERMQMVGRELGISVHAVLTDGLQPVGRGIGPALEALDALAVLQNQPEAPQDLRERSLMLAACVLEMGGKAAPGAGLALARATLASGAAWRKFQAICEAQGGMRTPPRAAYTQTVDATCKGQVVAVNTRMLGQIAQLAGAPKSAAAGLVFHAPLGTSVWVGQPLFTLHAESPGELARALTLARTQEHLISISQI